MKKFYFLFLFALIASIGNLYAAEKTVTWNFAGRKSGTNATTSCELKMQTGSASGTWKISASEAFHAQTGRGSTSVTLGSKNDPCTDAKLELTNSPIPEGAQIKKVSITAKTNNAKGATFGLQIGGVSSETTLTFDKTKTTQEFTESKVGNVVLVINTLNQSNVSLYSISITYEEVAETKCAKPTFNLENGKTYTDAQTLVITSTTADATIHYTINRGEEKTGQPAEFTENGEYTVDAWATKDNLTESDHASIKFTIAKKCATPTFNLTADATYTDVQDLVITSTTEGAQIEYKIEGDKLTAPITGKQASPATVHLTANDTYIVTATATKEGFDASESAVLMFTIAKKCAAPTFSLVSGSYTTAQTVTITGPEGSTITYTLNEAIFEAPSPVNVELPLVEGVSTTYNLSALASMNGFKDSEETKAVYVINESYADKTATLNIADYASANKWVNSKQYPDVEIDDVKFAIKGGGNDGKYYKSNYSWRVYASTPGTLTISVPAMHIISSVVYKAANAFAEADSGTLSEGTAAGEWKWNAAATNTTEGDPVNSVIFTAGDNKNVELKEVTVYYAYDPVSSVSSMSAEGVKVFAAEGGVEVVAEEAAEVAVYTAAGQLVRQARVAEGSTLVNVAPGFYVVRANGTATKVIVR